MGCDYDWLDCKYCDGRIYHTSTCKYTIEAFMAKKKEAAEIKEADIKAWKIAEEYVRSSKKDLSVTDIIEYVKKQIPNVEYTYLRIYIGYVAAMDLNWKVTKENLKKRYGG